MDASATLLAPAEAASAPIQRCDGNDVRTAANCEPMQTNAIPSENTIKHSGMEMFFIVELTMIAETADQVPQRARGEANCRLLIRR